MRILILNAILYTADNRQVPKVKSIKDCMIYSLGQAFCELGNEVTLIAASDYEPTEQENYDFSVLFFPSKWKKLFQPSVFPFQPKLWPFLRKHKSDYDLIVSSEVFAIPSLFAVLQANDKTVVWQELNAHNRMMKKLPSKIWYNGIARCLFRRTAVVPRSEAAYQFIHRYCPNTRHLIVDHGVNLDKFQVADRKEQQFVIVSQLIRRKNVDYMIRQFADFVQQDEYRTFRLLIAGKGEEENVLKQLVKELNISDNVRFLGFLNHETLSRLVAESMAMLIHTRQDLNMVSIPESIVSGTPIVTNTVPLLAGYIHENGLGIVRDSWTSSDLAEIVIRNDSFVRNCVAQREELSSTHSARVLMSVIS